MATGKLLLFFSAIICTCAIAFCCIENRVYARENTIVLAADPWPPYYGPGLLNGGFVSEVVEQSFYRAGYRLEVRFVPWKRAMESSRRGESDGLLGAFYKKSREKYFVYSDPVFETRMVFFAKKDRQIRCSGLEDLSGYRIGVIRGYRYSEEFDSADYLLKEEVTGMEQNIRKTLMGRIDVFIGSRDVVLELLRTGFPEHKNELETIGDHRINQLYVPISKAVENHEQLVLKLNAGLKEIRSDGTFDRIRKKHGF
ncbi:MAG: transporter substrate-binding domain-containing protein [Desulfobacteraceae bacterium]